MSTVKSFAQLQAAPEIQAQRLGDKFYETLFAKVTLNPIPHASDKYRGRRPNVKPAAWKPPTVKDVRELAMRFSPAVRSYLEKTPGYKVAMALAVAA